MWKRMLCGWRFFLEIRPKFPLLFFSLLSSSLPIKEEQPREFLVFDGKLQSTIPDSSQRNDLRSQINVPANNARRKSPSFPNILMHSTPLDEKVDESGSTTASFSETCFSSLDSRVLLFTPLLIPPSLPFHGLD